MNNCDHCTGECEYDEAEKWHQTLNQFDDDGAMRVLKTYLALHQGKIGQHWLWCAIERIGCGEKETAVLADYGWKPE